MNNYRINLNISNFQKFIEGKYLYIDKTMFIEHFLKISDTVMLITRPRRMGKSLNVDMLRAFLDCKQDTAFLFKGLAIENSEYFNEINKYPVVYMNFKALRKEDFKQIFRYNVCRIINNYLPQPQLNSVVKSYYDNDNNFSSSILLNVSENIYNVYGVEPIVIIDEYDKILMDNADNSAYEDIKRYLAEIFESTFKDNPNIRKGLMVGVTRVSKESLLSGLNNITVYDLLTRSIFDTDFGLTENEIDLIIHEANKLRIRDWYNNIHVGGCRIYNLYSVLSYLHFGEISNYWGNSGSIDLLIRLMNPNSSIKLARLINGQDDYILTRIDFKLSLRELLKSKNEIHYYSFAVQTGYLTFEKASNKQDDYLFKLSIPNKELLTVWREQILIKVVGSKDRTLSDIFTDIHDTDLFNDKLTEFISHQLSYFDLEDELEKTYHVFVFGMILALGYKCKSNLESGLGRYDLFIEADDFIAVMEFKKAYKETELESKADLALKQIDRNKYTVIYGNSKPVYKIGIGCYKKMCIVKTKQEPQIEKNN